MYACMYVLYAYIRVCMHLCVYACMYICMHVCIQVCIYVIFKLGVERYGGNCLSWEGELSGGNCPGEVSGGNCPGGNVRAPQEGYILVKIKDRMIERREEKIRPASLPPEGTSIYATYSSFSSPLKMIGRHNHLELLVRCTELFSTFPVYGKNHISCLSPTLSPIVYNCCPPFA